MSLLKRFALTTGLALLFFYAGCDSSETAADLSPSERPFPFRLADGFTGEVFVEGLDLPTSIAFPPDGSNRLFINELNSGRILIADNGELLDEPFAVLETNVEGTAHPGDGDNGLIGITFDPDYADNGFVYVTYARRVDGDTHAGDPAFLGRVVRFTDVDNRGEDATVLLDSIPGGTAGHQVHSLTFGPDEKLYVSTGDAFMEEAVQDTTSQVGKILRMNADGTIPDDNPFPDSYTYALGLRNSFDLAFDEEGVLYTADNGPTPFDRINRIEAGDNYGWPEAFEDTDSNLADPIHVWQESVGPTSLLFYEGDQLPETYQGEMLMVLFGPTANPTPLDRTKRIQVVRDLDAEAGPSFQDIAWYDLRREGNPLDIAVGPDGSLYLSDIFQGRVFKIRYDE